MTGKEISALSMKIFGFIVSSGTIKEDKILKLINDSELSPNYICIDYAFDTLLDCGLLSYKSAGGETFFSVKKESCMMNLDISGDVFHATVCCVDGNELLNLDFQTSNMYFFDENVAFFLRETASFTAKRKRTDFLGISLILPDRADTVSSEVMISDAGQQRIRTLLHEYFHTNNIVINHRASFAAEALSEGLRNVLCIIINNRTSAAAFASAGSETKYSDQLHTMSGRLPELYISSNNNTESSVLAAADSAANLLSLLSPEIMLLDVPHIYNEDGVRLLRRCLSERYCFTESSLPRIIADRIGNYCRRGTMKQLIAMHIASHINSMENQILLPDDFKSENGQDAGGRCYL